MMNRASTLTAGLFALGTLLGTHTAEAATAAEIDAGAKKALDRCTATVESCKSFSQKAKGILVFPEITAAGAGIGGAYGEGALLVDGKPVGRYSLTAGSIGLQLGAQKYAQAIMFMTPEALQQFRASSGWSADAAAGVTWIDEGTSATAGTMAADRPVVVFAFGEKGLMGAAVASGTKISPLEPGK